MWNLIASCLKLVQMSKKSAKIRSTPLHDATFEDNLEVVRLTEASSDINKLTDIEENTIGLIRRQFSSTGLPSIRAQDIGA